ncbi:hypothetical protein OIN60_04250 [Paenibacillus sp. P96]|uniref:DUF4239 domain-containing protein n=1 Tax=Paenibacillus zeirhizosphaerae TaxID=2987519 RepID=A0ABT9FMS3_9BACL|nr:hypothetical protein [Paenibacillus sp. P96]MDP4095998.1 hypothetical protein [Paenibacillus sp. P96]
MELTAFLTENPAGALPLLIAAAVIVWLYAHSAVQLRLSRRRRLDELQESLYLYGRLAGPLHAAAHGQQTESDGDIALVKALEECKSAPYLTPYLQEEIQNCLDRRDGSRISLLHRSLDREMNKLIEERRRLLQETHAPRWGTALWNLLRPAAAPAAVAGIVLLTWRLNLELQFADPALSGMTLSVVWMRYISGLLAVVYVYRLLSLRRQNGIDVTASHLPASVLSFLIAAVALLQWIGPHASPYILGAQLLLFLSGFMFTRERPRSKRPYAGTPDQTGQARQTDQDEQHTDQGTAETGPAALHR